MYSTMKKELYAGTVAFMFLFLVTYTTSANAQNLTTNASNAVGNASASVNRRSVATELGKNASNTGETILNQTGEVAKKIVGGAANVVSNISGEIKKGIGDK